MPSRTALPFSRNRRAPHQLRSGAWLQVLGSEPALPPLRKSRLTSVQASPKHSSILGASYACFPTPFLTPVRRWWRACYHPSSRRRWRDCRRTRGTPGRWTTSSGARSCSATWSLPPPSPVCLSACLSAAYLPVLSPFFCLSVPDYLPFPSATWSPAPILL